MNWTDLLRSRTVQTHVASANEMENLRELIARDLTDATLAGLSADRRFATTYNAVLQLSKIAIACAGYRIVAGGGHHQKTLEAVKLALNTPEAEQLANYFDACRRKRNRIDYDAASVASDTEAIELFKKAQEFQTLVESWITTNHPSFKK